MVAKLSPNPHDVARALRTIADGLDKQTAPLSDEMARELVPLVSRLADIAELADALEVTDVMEAVLIRDEIAAARAARRAGG